MLQVILFLSFELKKDIMIEKQGYTLRFPFRLARGQEVVKLDQPYEFKHIPSDTNRTANVPINGE